MKRVLCAGLITVDFTYEIAAFPVEGTKNRAHGARTAAGGGALAAAIAVTRLGGKAALAGTIGDDQQGRFLREEFRRLGIDDALVETVTGSPTPQSAVVISANGERTVINHRADALMTRIPRLIDVLDADAVLVDSRWAAGAEALLAAAAAAGLPAIVDGEAPMSGMAAALAHATHVVFSEQGLADFRPGATVDALRQAAHYLNTWVAVTRGERSVLCCQSGIIQEVPTFAALPVDTLGAGDAWHGAFSLALARGEPELHAARYANAVAALKVARPSHEGLPSHAEATALMAGRH